MSGTGTSSTRYEGSALGEVTSNLAIRGGTPVRRSDWPRWPQPAPAALSNLEQVLHSGRWAISGPYAGAESFERRFAAAFAAYNEANHCVLTASGTASLMVGLEACGVGAGDEVIIPGLTWVANASTVAGVNAVPVLADVDPRTFCIDPASVESLITTRTAAIVVVHLYAALADLDALVALADRHGLVLIEDCAQSPGARYRGRRVGTFGALGTYSMQQTKTLTSGEGGAVVTNRSDLARAAEHLRADGRCFTQRVPPIGEMELVETGELMGSNRSLSEFQSALLSAQLPLLDEQHATRRRNLEILDGLLLEIGFWPQETSAGTTERTIYEYAVEVVDDDLAEVGIERLAQAVSAELGLAVEPGYPALSSNVLYDPPSRRRFSAIEGSAERLRLDRFDVPVAERLASRLLTIQHTAFLGQPGDMHDIAEAFAKVSQQRDMLLA